LNLDPPCRLNFDPGMEAGIVDVVVGRAMRVDVGQRSVAFVRGSIRTTACEVSWLLWASPTARWRSSPTVRFNFASGFDAAAREAYPGLVPPATKVGKAQRRGTSGSTDGETVEVVGMCKCQATGAAQLPLLAAAAEELYRVPSTLTHAVQKMGRGPRLCNLRPLGTSRPVKPRPRNRAREGSSCRPRRTWRSGRRGPRLRALAPCRTRPTSAKQRSGASRREPPVRAAGQRSKPTVLCPRSRRTTSRPHASRALGAGGGWW
jgi:hypothetical protein